MLSASTTLTTKQDDGDEITIVSSGCVYNFLAILSCDFFILLDVLFGILCDF